MCVTSVGALIRDSSSRTSTLWNAATIRIDNEEEVVTAEDAVLEFKGISVLPIPYITFPLSEKRKSGLLPPTIGIDSRDGVFPPQLPTQVETEHSEPVQDAVATLPAGARVLIMSFSHAEDLDIVVACLQRLRTRDDLPFVGLIGSKTKWATFRRRLEARGFTAAEIARITCPIGVPGIAA